jgi:hypothetical protein
VKGKLEVFLLAFNPTNYRAYKLPDGIEFKKDTTPPPPPASASTEPADVFAEKDVRVRHGTNERDSSNSISELAPVDGMILHLGKVKEILSSLEAPNELQIHSSHST